MLRFLFIAIIISFTGRAQNFIAIQDKNFVSFLSERFPACMNGNLLNADCSAIVSTESLQLNSLQLSNLQGIEAFVNLKSLECVENNLTEIPTLPAGLLKLDCSMNQLTALPTLPPTLTDLSCAVNKLNVLPKLPSSLTVLYCNFNEINSLPVLPESLEYLACGSNKIRCLPALPSSIFMGDISMNPLNCVSKHAEWMDEESLKLPVCVDQDEISNPNRCICISSTLMSLDKQEENELITASLGENQMNSVVLYPNPSKEKITIKSDESMNAIIIKDIEGKVVKTASSTALYKNHQEFDLTDLISGIYFVQTTVGNTVTTYKIVKTN